MPDGFSQDRRLVRLNTVLGPTALIPDKFTSTEQLSHGFTLRVTCFSETLHEIKPKDVVGTTANVQLVLQDNSLRNFHGFITSFEALGSSRAGEQTQYSLTMSSWLETLLAKRTDCRIFQGKSAQQIIEEVFAAYGSDADFKFDLAGSPATRRYCVQYNESDLNFVKRLCQSEGMVYYFAHSEAGHTLTLVDSADKMPDLNPKMVKLKSNTIAEDHLSSWISQGSFATGKFEQRAFNYKSPSTPVSATTSSAATATKSAKVQDLESYIYSETFVGSDDGTNQINARANAATERSQIARGRGDKRDLYLGHNFELELASGSWSLGGIFTDKGQEFTIVSTQLDADCDSAQTNVIVEATPKGELIYPKGTQPRIQGLQTAIVTGPEGKEIHTDVEGRIKVQFHWDRLGGNDENTTAWMRVMQSFAGAGFGGHFTPRIGQEVVVAFENGNPDRPFVLGALYHPEHLPPYGDQLGTRAGIRTRSTEGGATSNYNELYFEDKLGSEEVYLQAEKDHNVWIKNDESRKVDNNKTQTIGVNETKTVGENYTEEVGSNSDVKVGTNYTIDVGDTLAITAGSEITLTVGGSSIKITGSKIEVSSSAVAIDGSTVDVTGLINLN